ncbi:MAG: SDR family oxidoreductase [Candidatus Freyarchaeum deiterrae]
MILEHKVIVITGSTRGIGLAVAEACAKEGAQIVICSRHESAVKQTIKAFKQQGYSVSGIKVDVSVPGDIEKLLQHAVETWGRVDVWVNNAGLSGGIQTLDAMSEEEITSIVNVNLTAMLQACRIIIPYFIQHDGGTIINLSGRGGRLEESPYMVVYAATKAAVSSLTKSLAKENKGKPISIHAVIPGMVETDFYKDIKVSSNLEEMAEGTPYALKAFSVPSNVVGNFFVKIAAQKPGEVTGKIYRILGGRRLMRGIGLMMYYRSTGKVKGRM